MFDRTIAVLRSGTFTSQERREAIAEISKGYEARFYKTRVTEFLARGLAQPAAEQLAELDLQFFAKQQFEKIVDGHAELVG